MKDVLKGQRPSLIDSWFCGKGRKTKRRPGVRRPFSVLDSGDEKEKACIGKRLCPKSEIFKKSKIQKKLVSVIS